MKLKLYWNKEMFKKFTFKLMPLVIASVITLSGCGKKEDKSFDISHDTSNNSSISSDIESTNHSSNPSQINKVNNNGFQEAINAGKNLELDEQTKQILTSSINFMESDNQSFQDYLKTFTTDYLYSDLFQIESALAKYDSFKEVDTNSNKVIKNNSINENELYDIVIQNNEAFLNKDQNDIIFEELSTSKIKDICIIVANTLNEFLKNNPQIDINELDANLADLKVLQTESFINASITEDGCLAVNLRSIESLISNTQNSQAFNLTIIHEVYHLIQRSSVEEKKLEGYTKNIGICYSWDSLDINPLYYEWFFEASAEKMAATYNDNKPIVYETPIGYLNSINLATSLDDKSSNLEYLTLTKNLDQLFATFNNNGLITREEVIKMMYAIDFILLENKDLLNKYEKVNGQPIDYSEVANLKYQYNSSVYQTLTKKFYSDLALKLSTNSFNLGDIFAIISLFENDTSNHLWYKDVTRLSFNSDFIVKYADIQQSFFQLIANKLNVTLDEVIKAYNVYNQNYSFESTSLSNRLFLQSISESVIHNKTISINQVDEALNSIESKESVKK